MPPPSELFPIFAGCALLLAAVGLYVVIAQSVGRRTREISQLIGVEPYDSMTMAAAR